MKQMALHLSNHLYTFEAYDLLAVAAVHDGYVLQKSVVRTPVGGSVLSQCMLASVAAKGITVDPTFAFRRREKTPGQFEVR